MRLILLNFGMAVMLFTVGCGKLRLSDYEKKQRGNALFRQAISAEQRGDIDGAMK